MSRRLLRSRLVRVVGRQIVVRALKEVSEVMVQ